MKKLRLITFCVFGFGTVFSQSVSPDVISSAGDFSTGSTVTVSWTLGECFTETFSTSNILTQGFQQPSYTITKIESIETSFNVSVYPNPASNLLNIDFAEKSGSELKIELVDILGKIITNIKTDAGISTIQLDLQQYAPEAYFLNISTLKGELLKSFQIVKF